MAEWYATQTGTPFKKWRGTSKCKSSEVSTIKPLDNLQKIGLHLITSETAKRLKVNYRGESMPPQEELLVLLGIWTLANVHEEGGPIEILHKVAPYMREEAVQRWAEKFEHLVITS